MSIGSIAQGIWSSATTALLSPNATTAAVSLPTTNANGSSSTSTSTSTTNATTGSSNPFQALSSDLQAWLNQNQASIQGQQGQPQVHRHHHGHHHAGGLDQAVQSYANANTASAAPPSQSIAA